MTKRPLREWDLFQLKLAKHYSSMSRDPQSKVGAVVCDKNSKHVYGLGYNGLPDYMIDNPNLLKDRDYKLQYTVHAEINALEQAGKRNLTLYDACTLVIYPFIACSKCAENISFGWKWFDVNVTRVVTLDYVPERWKNDFAKSEEILAKAGIEVVKYRKEELDD